MSYNSAFPSAADGSKSERTFAESNPSEWNSNSATTAQMKAPRNSVIIFIVYYTVQAFLSSESLKKGSKVRRITAELVIMLQ